MLIHSIALFRSALFSIGQVISTVLFGIVVVGVGYVAPQWVYAVSQQWSRFIITWLRLTCGVQYRLYGADRLPPGPVILCVNHQSTWETLFLHGWMPPMALVVKRELLQIPFFGWALAMLKPIAIDRTTTKIALKQVLTHGEARLKEGQWVLIFPEGTRVAAGEAQRYGVSGAMLACRSGYPIVPVAHNAGRCWPRHGFVKTPGVISVIFGAPIDAQGRSAKDVNAHLQQWMEKALQAIDEGRPESVLPQRTTE